MLFLVPTMIASLVATASRPADFASLRTLVYGAAPIPDEVLVRALEVLGPVLLQIYGLSECPFPITTLRKEDHLDPSRRGSCGLPTAQNEVQVLDPDGRPLGAGEVGTIAVRGPQLDARVLVRSRGDGHGARRRVASHRRPRAARRRRVSHARRSQRRRHHQRRLQRLPPRGRGRPRSSPRRRRGGGGRHPASRTGAAAWRPGSSASRPPSPASRSSSTSAAPASPATRSRCR